jgi:hypothetical protein
MTSARTAISLKKLVINMFFASSLIPLTGIAFTSLENIDVYRQIHTNKLRAAKEESLRNIIQNFSRYTASCSASLLQLTPIQETAKRQSHNRHGISHRKSVSGCKNNPEKLCGENIYTNSVEISAAVKPFSNHWHAA